MKRAVIYARVSKQREESVSIEAQIEQCTARAAHLGADVVKVFLDDGISGREARNRREFLKAKAFCQAANIHYFITWSTSRFARNMLELFHSQAELKEIGTKLECLNADIDDETDHGFVNKAIHGLMDEMYSRQVAKDTLRSQKQAAAAGYFTGGGVPFGYRSVKDGLRSRLQLDPAEVLVVKRIFDSAMLGKGALAIAMELNELGLLRRGKRWAKNTVNYILKNEMYTGVKTFNKTHRRSGKPKPREEWVQVPSHPAVVTVEDFERVQKMLEDRAPQYERGGTPRSMFLFTGLVECGNCSGKLQIRTGKGRAGALYSYYACLQHQNGPARCLFRAVRADLFDSWMLDQVLDHVVTPAAMQAAMTDLLAAGADAARTRTARRTELVAQIREHEARSAQLFDVVETQGARTPDLSAVLRRVGQLHDQVEQLQRELARLEALPAPGRPVDVDADVAVDVMRDVVKASDTKKKRAFLGAFIERITVGPNEVAVDYHPEALLDAGSGTSVRSDIRWLPDLGSNQGPTD